MSQNHLTTLTQPDSYGAVSTERKTLNSLNGNFKADSVENSAGVIICKNNTVYVCVPVFARFVGYTIADLFLMAGSSPFH